MSGAPRGMLRTVVLISGRGSNLLAIARAARAGDIGAEIVAVISDQPLAPGLAAAADLGLPCEVLAPAQGASRADYDGVLAEKILAREPDAVALAGFMRILSPPFVARFTGRLLNIHPSLLPKHRGLRTHERVLAAGETEHGCSVHFVTDELDGGPLIVQARVPVLAGDTVASLSARVQAQEHRIYPMTLDWLARKRLQWHDGAPWLDGRRLDEPVRLEDAESAPRLAR